jgi:hypothetical protein
MTIQRSTMVALLALGACFCAPVWGGELLPATTPVEQVVDHYIDAGLKTAGAQPAPRADDANLIRRLTLDLAGRSPTMPEAQAYLASSDADKRTQLVDRLIGSSEFLAHQTNELDTLLMYGSSASLHDYLSKALAQGRSWDQIFRDLIEGGDSGGLKGGDQFLKSRVKDNDRLTNDVSTLFFGVNISCAQCHDHPLVSSWKQDHFFGFKSFFNRTFDNGGFVAEREYGDVTFKTPKGEDRQASLMFLTGQKIDEPAGAEPSNEAKKKESEQLKEWAKQNVAPPPPKFSRRAQLIEVALQPGGSEFFARSIVNRLVNRLLGYGLVMPVDQMHEENPPSHPELLDWLARDCRAHGYDLTRIVRGLVLSEAYARSSRWEESSRPLPTLFAVANVRPLTPWQYAAALRVGTTDPLSFAAIEKPADLQRRIESLVTGSRGLAGLFDMPQENFQVSATEPLLFSNGDRIVSELLNDAGDRILGRLKQTSNVREQIELATWAILSRPPTPEEIDLLTTYLNERSDRPQEALRQMTWALLSGAECRFNY